MTTVAPPASWRGTNLLTARPDIFRRVVAGHLRADAPAELWQMLLSPSLVDRTIDTLKGIRTSSLAEFTDREARLAELAAKRSEGDRAAAAYRAAEKTHAYWHPRALAFVRHVQARCAVVETATGRSLSAGPVVQPQQDTSLAGGLAVLARAIAAHREATTATLDPEPQDTRLWGLLEGATIVHPDGRLQTLTEWAAQWGTTPAAAS